MKIHCECGHLIHDGTDGISNKGHMLPDRRWNELADAIDDAIERGESPRQREAAAMRIRALLSDMARTVWQCNACGVLYMEDGHRNLRAFRPAEDADVFGILAGR